MTLEELLPWLFARTTGGVRWGLERTGASFFEASTAIAFLCFAEAGVDTAVVEVGLGGRLDATSVVSPLVTAVTNVALDHMEYLGDSIEAIAREKGGIFRMDVPALTAAEGEALEALRAAAASAGAPLHLLDDRVELLAREAIPIGTRVDLRSRFWGERTLEIGLLGTHQVENGLLALELLGLLPARVRPAWERVERGFRAVRWPGRLQLEERAGTRWLFDVAHNPAGAGMLARSLTELALPRPLVLVSAILQDKAWGEMLPPLLDACDAAVLTTAPSAPSGRAWDPDVAATALRGSAGGVPLRVIRDLEGALQRAATLAGHGTVVVTGSFHTVGDAMRLLDVPTT